MKVIWRSCQGKDRKYNSDYGVFCNYSNYYVFIIGDAKEEIESQNFIKYILEFIAKKNKFRKSKYFRHIKTC